MSKVTVVLGPIVEREVTLTIPESHAITLQTILGSIGGSPTLSRRGQMDSIYNALDAAGIKSEGLYTKDLSGSIYFKDRV